ncbi:MAG: FAD-dependent oxidoreductase [Burkholderiales bacterium]|nr:FAD-dependent oxidoreductase [Burkholderiales bacterium]
MEPIVIIGSGMAGYGLLRELRKLDRETPVTVITADEGAAYAKPSLSNALATGKAPEQLANQTAAQISASMNAEVLTHTRVIRIDTAAQQIETDQGSVPYSHLVLALGADPIAHGVAGPAAGKILSVNDLGDYTRFRTALAGKKSVAILGGGLIGCEFANDLAAAGYEAAVVHLGASPLERILPAPIAQRLSESLAAAGVAWHFGRRAVSAETAGNGITLTLDDGSVLTADVVLSAIGLRPRLALAQAAGVAAGRGIVVDRMLQTSVSGIYAMGDCAEVEGWVLPYVQPLLQQARALAATLAGTPTPVCYPAMPVVVKTPVLPLTVAPPAPNQPGQWSMEMEAACLVARFKNEQGNLQGFVLCGQAPGLRSELTKQMPSVLP